MVSGSKLKNNWCPLGRLSPLEGPATSFRALSEQPAKEKLHQPLNRSMSSTEEQEIGGVYAGMRQEECSPEAGAEREE